MLMKRVLLKLSGEALAGEKKTGFDEETCLGVARQVKQLVEDGIQVAIVTGYGKRGGQAGKAFRRCGSSGRDCDWRGQFLERTRQRGH